MYHLKRSFTVIDLAIRSNNSVCYKTIISRLISTENWDLVSAVCLERKPVISSEKCEMENKFLTLLSQIEFEQSHLSDHEIRHKQDEAQAEVSKRGEDADVDQTLKQTAQDFEDSCVDELNKFQLACRVTVADTKNDLRSLERKLDKSLLLLVEQKLGTAFKWAMPQGVRADGETMRQTAERVLKERCGEKIKVRFMGNAPCGFHKYKYPKHVRGVPGGALGAKIFFFKAEHLAGQVEMTKSVVKDFKWLVREELVTSVPREYCKSVGSFMINE